MLRGLIGGLIGGAIGAAIWAGIALVTDYELGIVAWGIGGLVGAGVAIGSRGNAGPGLGVLAALLAIGAIAVGKYAAVSIIVDRYVKDKYSDAAIQDRIEHDFTDQTAKAYMAHSLIAEGEKSGTIYKWPEGVDPDEAETAAQFPKEVWADVEKRWGGMKPDARETYKSQAKEAMIEATKEGAHNAIATGKSVGFLASFSVFDLLWSFLAIGTAYRVATQDE